MACLRPITLRNPKYKDTDKSIFDILPKDWMLSVPCGKCLECNKAKARDWRARLLLEVDYWTKQKKKCYFVTFTLSDDTYDYWCLNSDKPVRLFLENYRRKVGKSCKHFIITELGKTTQRLHYHGILFGPELSLYELKKLWIYGFSFFGYCSYKTAKYVSKYILKPQLSEPWYKPKKFVSPGLGKHYLSTDSCKRQQSQPCKDDMYIRIDSFKYAMPRYLRQKVYKEEFLHSIQYDRYYRSFLLDDLKFGQYRCSTVDEYLNLRETRLLDSIDRKMTKKQVKPNRSNLDIIPNDDFRIVDYGYLDWLNGSEPF